MIRMGKVHFSHMFEGSCSQIFHCSRPFFWILLLIKLSSCHIEVFVYLSYQIPYISILVLHYKAMNENYAISLENCIVCARCCQFQDNTISCKQYLENQQISLFQVVNYFCDI